MNVVVDTEPLTDELFAQIVPLAQKCWDESTAVKGEDCAYHGERSFAIEPDSEQYMALQKSGALLIITLRDEGTLRGYLIGIHYRALHHRKVTCGLGDSMYLEPQYRFHHAGAVAEKFEAEMTARGAGIIGWPAHLKSPLYEFLKARGYVGDDIVMEKRLETSLCV